MVKVLPIMLREEFNDFLLLCKRDPEFPASYEAWMASHLAEEIKYRKSSVNVQNRTVHAPAFGAWCELSGVQPSYQLLSLFAENAET